MRKIKYFGEYWGIPIFRDYDIPDDEQVYIGNGQGCDTFWFRSVEDAKKFIDRYRDRMTPNVIGLGLIPRSVCKRCSNHYPSGSRGYIKYPPNACEGLKERLKRRALRT